MLIALDILEFIQRRNIMIYKICLKSLLVLFILTVFVSFSCSVKNNESGAGESEENTAEETIDENEINETDSDLFKTDFREIYNELSDKGEWVRVNAEEIGIDVNRGDLHGEIELQKLLSEITGVKNAYADDADLGFMFVWKPSTDLAVSLGSDNLNQPEYRPYYNGQWLNTDNGWYFNAPTPEEEIVHHYGRWNHNPALGWVWVPGRVWSPAWVDWKVNDSYVAWTPVPAGVYIQNEVIEVPVIPEEKYAVVEKRYFVKPMIYEYIFPVVQTVIIYPDLRPVSGITVVNGSVINYGPSVVTVSSVVGSDIPKIKLKKVKRINEVRFVDNEIRTYYPEFKRGKNKNFVVISKPNKFKRIDEVNMNTSSGAKDINDPKNNNGKNENGMKNNKKDGNQNENFNQNNGGKNNNPGIDKNNKGGNKKDINKNDKNVNSNKGNNNKPVDKQEKKQQKNNSDKNKNKGNSDNGNKKGGK